MNGFAKLLFLLPMIAPGMAPTPNPAVIESVMAEHDARLDLDPANPFWKGSRPVYMEKDGFGKTVTRYRTEVFTRWTTKNIYFLFVCPYEELFLKPSPTPEKETYKLWDWDVAEVFIGSDLSNINRYKEFEMSPQGEWIDLDIDLNKPHHEEGWTWNSGFEVKARIDRASKTWYGAMRIPMAAIDTRPAAAGNTMRINLFRSQGPPSHRQEVVWQPPMKASFHVPERFGLIQLVER
jgi:hypothetical protein